VLDLTLPAGKIVQATPRTRIIQAELGSERFEFVAGQAVFAGLADSAVRRPYSIACSPGQARRAKTLELLVQIDDHETPDPHLERAVPGTLLRIQGPFGSFALPQDFAGESLLLIAGGTGIAPLRAMMWDVLERQSRAAISVLYSARTPDEFAYLTELRELSARGRIELVLTTTRGTPESWQGLQGRVNQDVIGQMLRAEGHAVICGPASLVADATAMLAALGVPPHRILTETYAG
jgi:NAD(P)H-flavin reductase